MPTRVTITALVFAAVLASITWALASLLLNHLGEPTADRWATAGVLGIVCTAVAFLAVERWATGAPAPTYAALPWWANLSDPLCWPEDLAEPPQDAP